MSNSSSSLVAGPATGQPSAPTMIDAPMKVTSTLDADPIGARHHHAVLRRGRHGHVVALAVPAVVPDRALERCTQFVGTAMISAPANADRTDRLGEPEVEADDDADPAEGQVDDRQLDARLEPRLLVVIEVQLPVRRQAPGRSDQHRAVVTAVTVSLVETGHDVAPVRSADVAQSAHRGTVVGILGAALRLGLIGEHVPARRELRKHDQVGALRRG